MICSRCIYDDKIPGISFDRGGDCKYCDKDFILSFWDQQF
jgi:hypothetical protein